MRQFKWLFTAAALCCVAGMGSVSNHAAIHRLPSSDVTPTLDLTLLPPESLVSPDQINCFKKTDYSKRELHGVWVASVDSDALNSPSNIEQAMGRLENMHFNTVFPTVWNKGAVFFNDPRSVGILGQSQYMPAALNGRDVLADVIQSARAHALRVVPWFEYGLKVPSDIPLVSAHPEWFLRDANQTLEQPLGSFKVAYLNPFHPDVQDFLIRFYTAALDNYDVDAIQLDDHFSIPVSFGYDDTTVALYKSEHQGNPPPANVYDTDWMKWRADKFTDFVGKLSSAVHARGKRLSLSPNLYYYAYSTSLQNWIQWALKGYIDEIVMQVYRRDLDSLQGELNKDYVRSISACVPFSVGVLAGVSGSPVNPIDLIKQQSLDALSDNRKLDGVSFFHYSFLTDKADSPVQMTTGLQELFDGR